MLPKAAVTITTGSVAKTAQICDLIGLGGQSPSQVSLASAPSGGSRGEAILCPFQLLELLPSLAEVAGGAGVFQVGGAAGAEAPRCNQEDPDVHAGETGR